MSFLLPLAGSVLGPAISSLIGGLFHHKGDGRRRMRKGGMLLGQDGHGIHHMAGKRIALFKKHRLVPKKIYRITAGRGMSVINGPGRGRRMLKARGLAVAPPSGAIA